MSLGSSRFKAVGETLSNGPLRGCGQGWGLPTGDRTRKVGKGCRPSGLRGLCFCFYWQGFATLFPLRVFLLDPLLLRFTDAFSLA